MTTRLRPTSPDDTPALATLIVSQREHLVPWEPARPESWFTAEGQREVLEQADADRAAGRSHAFVITDGSCALIGRLNLASVVRGAGQFCSLGYWVAREQTGRGVATTAVRQALRIAFDHLNPDQSGGWPNGGAPTPGCVGAVGAPPQRAPPGRRRHPGLRGRNSHLGEEGEGRGVRGL